MLCCEKKKGVNFFIRCVKKVPFLSALIMSLLSVIPFNARKTEIIPSFNVITMDV